MITKIKKISLVIYISIRKVIHAKKLPLAGFGIPTLTPLRVDTFSDEELIDLNKLINWNCFCVDKHGRRFGSVAWNNKRTEPETIPDRRIDLMHRKFNLKDKTVLEVGCFEGIHTVGLMQYARKVIAIDSRVDHVVKTLVRTSMFGFLPTVFKCDVEEVFLDTKPLEADYLHHVGVLYHLRNPIDHLLKIGTYIKKGLMLDTHYADPADINGSYEVNGRSYSYKYYAEYGRKEAFSGMYDHSKWLLLEDIIECLKVAGFPKVDIVEKRDERNGPRVLLFAERA